MRHNKHRHILGVKKEHRSALMASLASALITHGRIQTTLAKAKALRPFVEKVITLAKRAKVTENTATAIHYRRQALSKLRNKDAVSVLFNEKAEAFLNRNGGYTRIYKLVRRQGDAAEVAIIELIAADDEGYSKTKPKKVSGKGKAVAEAPEAGEAVVSDAEEKTTGA
jgi:large subunit ribosomal protein L17